MLFGQLESKVKYQVVRKAAGAAAKHQASRLSRAGSRSTTKGSQKRSGKPAREAGKKKPAVKARQKLPKSKAKPSPRKRSTASKGGHTRA
jgi:hypothetical protein